MKAHLSSKLAPLELSRVLSFSLPALGAVLNDPLMSLVDTACVGQVSSIELAALGPNTSIFGFASMVFHFLTVASTVQVSRAHDKNDLASKSHCISDALSLALLCGVLSPVFLFACGGTLLRVMYTPPELIVPAQNYLTIRSFALPATLVSLVGTAACLGQRDARTPLNIALATGTLNLLTNVFLVLGPPNMGILGSALATVASAWCGATLFCLHLLRGPLHLSLRVPTAKRAEPFISAGSVLIIRSVCVMSCYSLATSASSAMGTLTLAGHQVLVGVMTVAQFCPEPLSSCAQASLASIGARSVRGRSARPRNVVHAENNILTPVLFCCTWSRLVIVVLWRLGILSSCLHRRLGCHHGHTFSCPSSLGLCGVLYASLCDGWYPLRVREDGIFCCNTGKYSKVTLFLVAECRHSSPGCVDTRLFLKKSASFQVFNLPLLATFIMLASRGGFGLVGVWWSILCLFIIRFLQNAMALFLIHGRAATKPRKRTENRM